MARDNRDDRPRTNPAATGPTADELPRTAPRLDAPRVPLADLPPEASSSAAPATSVDVIPQATPASGPDPALAVAPGSTSAEREQLARELVEERRKADSGDPAANHDRLHDLHYLVRGEEPPR